MTEDKLQKIKEVLAVVDRGYATTEEVALAFKTLLEAVKAIKKEWRDELNADSAEMKACMTTFNALERRLTTFVEQKNADITDRFYKLVNNEVYKLEKLFSEIPQFDDSPLREQFKAVIADLERKIDLKKPPTPIETRDALETLKEDERLDKSAVKGIEEIEKKVKQIELRPSGQGGGGLRGIDLSVDGTSRGQIQYLNLVAGSNITLTLTKVGERHDVLIDASGGSGSFSKLTATGTVDGVNKDFTFTSAPSIIIVDGGRAMQKVSSDGTVNWTGTTSVTLTVAPTQDIYGF